MNTAFTPSPPAQGGVPDVLYARRTIVCFSHLRWGFVHQRPQHVLSHAARTDRVFFIEEPIAAPGESTFRMQVAASGVMVLTPCIDPAADQVLEQQKLVADLHRSLKGDVVTHWFYTPMALRFVQDQPCHLCVYDCMDELSAFRFAPPELKALERALLDRADLVFTGGRSLFEAKRAQHPDVHCFPSSVDTDHFARARQQLTDPGDQAGLAQPRIGFAGVIDERIDLDLIATAAAAMPEVQFVMLGPTAKIDPATLPRAANIHWLGCKDYADLPAYMANWQAAWMPFALNDATRFISPTKTPEYLAAGLPVASTAVADVVASYGRQGLVTITDAATVATDLRACLSPATADWSQAVDRALRQMSWARTWRSMQALMMARSKVAKEPAHV
ncbi:MAG: glycosyltransferase [Pseudotabrizicola sp.]|uniref:glycosyltransferase n=1 Tax=Pseudotabrizicola sp. TaxID=2939647 RepID=UPI002717F810|nr:glycosyltransferase [Pseudotabrizicola sp.]MDO9639885.1 glycosyltransferase [Pseudotabrizicola sp.]